MTQNLKALVVVLGLALIVFGLAKPLALRFMLPQVFVRRRNVWLGLTVVAFVSPSFWFYALAAVPTLYWLGKKDPNPLAVYLLMLHVVPSMAIEIPTVVINNLFEVSNFRILAFVLLLPALVSAVSRGRMQWGIFWRFDLFVFAFAGLQLILLVPYEGLTHTMRRGFLYSIDSILLYLVFSRVGVDKRKVADAMSALVLSAAIMAAVAVFEYARTWLLYVNINEIWGDPNHFAWLLRGDALRAQGPAGHAIVLGYWLAMALAFWLYLQRFSDSAAVRFSVHILLWAGMVASGSRGPWVAAVVGYVVFYALSPQTSGRILPRFATLAVALGAIAMTPLGTQIIDKLPFIGSEGAESVTYRQQLAETAWLLIQQNPFFGSPFVMQQLESLRQGQGIIDLVNSYAAIAMFYGVVGLGLFLGSYVMALFACVRWTRVVRRFHPDDASLAAAICACMTATLVMIATVSLVHAVPIFYWVLTGLGAALASKLGAMGRHVPVGQNIARVPTS